MKKELPIRQLFTWEIRTDETARRIDEYRLIDKKASIDIGEDDKDSSEGKSSIFEGLGHVLQQISPQQVSPMEIHFPIDADTIEDAFARYDESARAFIEDQQKRARQSSIEIAQPNEIEMLTQDSQIEIP